MKTYWTLGHNSIMEHKQARKTIGVGAGLTFVGVALGAFGAHGLRERIPSASMAIYQTGVQYHLLHSVALIAIAGIASEIAKPSKIEWIVRLMIAGIVIFSGSLYLLAITQVKILGAITPIGGVCFLTAWILLCHAALSKEPNSESPSG